MTDPAPEPDAPQILIVGAGPTGLVLALCLATAGIAVRVIDARAVAATTSRAIGIQARTLELLELFGLADTFVAQGLRARAGNVYAGTKRLVHLDLSRLQSRFPFILLLEQTETERLLTRALGRLGVTVERGVELVSFEQDPGGVTARLSDQGVSSTARFAYLAGCDGAHSVVRHALNIGFAGRTLDQRFVLADLDINWALPNDQFHIFTSAQGLMAIFPMRRGHRLIAETPAASVDPAGGPTLPQLQALVAGRTPTAMALSDLRWSSFFRVNSRLATRLRGGRVFLVGDAAHIHSPAGAQGMNTGVQDAVNLAWKLALVAGGKAQPALLDSYETERYPVEKGVLTKTEALTRMVSLKGALPRRIRDLVAPVVTRTGLVQRLARDTISQISVGYRVGAAGRHGLADGDRVPDLLIEPRPTGPAQRLYPLLDPAGFTLLVVSAEEPDRAHRDLLAALAPRQVKVIAARRAGDARRGIDPDGFFLIRPDAYLAIQGPLSRLGDARAWLDARLGPATARR